MFTNFAVKLVAIATSSLGGSEKEVQIDHLRTKCLQFRGQIVKIGSVDLEIVDPQEIFKTRNARQSLAYSPRVAPIAGIIAKYNHAATWRT